MMSFLADLAALTLHAGFADTVYHWNESLFAHIERIGQFVVDLVHGRLVITSGLFQKIS